MRDHPRRPRWIDFDASHQRGQASATGLVARRGYWRRFRPLDLRSHIGEEGVRDSRRRSVPHRARTLAQRRRARRFVGGHAVRCGTSLLPRANRAEARCNAHLRQRREVPLQDVQRLLDGGQRLHRAQEVRRHPRSDRSPTPRERGLLPHARSAGCSGDQAHAHVLDFADGGCGREGSRRRHSR